MRVALELEGDTVEEACDGQQGIACHRVAPADPIITDIPNPENDGLEIIQELRQEIPVSKIIAISGGGRQVDSTSCRWRGYLASPVRCGNPLLGMSYTLRCRISCTANLNGAEMLSLV